MGFFKELFEQNSFVGSLNATFLDPIPMKRGANDLKDFRSISLIGSLHKLLAKVLVSRPKLLEKYNMIFSMPLLREGRL